MKKHRKWIILISLFVVIPGLMIAYLQSMPSLKDVLSIYPRARALPELQQITLDEIKPRDGYKLSAYGYSLTLAGYETAEDKSLDRNNTVFYVIGKNKGVLMTNPDNGTGLGNAFFEDDAFRRSVEAYTGKRPETIFDCLHAYCSASVNDISLFNNRRNEGLYYILYFKSRYGNPGYTSISEFAKDDIKGFILTFGTDVPVVEACVFKQSDPNREYGISFMRFTPQEALPILSSLAFED